MRRRTAILVALAALAGCDSGPFVYMDPQLTLTLNKTPDLIRRTGSFIVCFGDGELKAADALASETCAGYKLRAIRHMVQRYQCSFTKPHQAIYMCVDPAMRMANGAYINPMNHQQVKAWQLQQQRIRQAELRHADAAPPAAAPAAPGAAELGAPPAPAIPATVPAAKPPPAPPAATPSADNLPESGWGRAWDAADGEGR